MLTPRKHMSHRLLVSQSISIVIILWMSCGHLLAQGDLMIFPKRVVFDGKKNVEQLSLANVGKDTATYNISFLEYRMTEEGQFEALTEPDAEQNFATPYLRVYPRKVVLAPNEFQTVKVQVMKSGEMKEGEYRSHLYFRAEEKNLPLGLNSNVNDSTVAVKLNTVYGLSIACIIRKGTSDTSVSISAVSYNQDKDANDLLHFSLNRTGNMSIYGDITVLYTTANNTTVEVGQVKGVAVYTPGKIRKTKLKLEKPEDINFSGGSFKIIYTQNESKKVLAETEWKL